MIIELYGLPGSGKSYLIQQINGNKPIGMMTDNKVRQLLIGMMKKAAILAPSSILLKKQLKTVVYGAAEKPVYFEWKKQYYLDNLTMIAFGYRWSGKKNIFMDEGIVHRLVSFAVNYDLPVESVLAMVDTFRDYLMNVEVFYLDTDIEKCVESIQKRNRHGYKMDELTGDKLYCFVNNYRKYFDVITREYSYRTVTRDHYEEIKQLLI